MSVGPSLIAAECIRRRRVRTPTPSSTAAAAASSSIAAVGGERDRRIVPVYCAARSHARVLRKRCFHVVWGGGGGDDAAHGRIVHGVVVKRVECDVAAKQRT